MVPLHNASWLSVIDCIRAPTPNGIGAPSWRYLNTAAVSSGHIGYTVGNGYAAEIGLRVGNLAVGDDSSVESVHLTRCRF